MYIRQWYQEWADFTSVLPASPFSLYFFVWNLYLVTISHGYHVHGHWKPFLPLRVNNPSLLRLTPDRWWRSTRFHPLWNDRSPPWRSSARRNALLPGPAWASLHGYETVQETNYDSDKTDVIFDGVLIDTLRSIFDWHNITVQYHATSIGGCKCKTVLFGTCHRMSQAWQDESGGT